MESAPYWQHMEMIARSHQFMERHGIVRTALNNHCIMPDYPVVARYGEFIVQQGPRFEIEGMISRVYFVGVDHEADPQDRTDPPGVAWLIEGNLQVNTTFYGKGHPYFAMALYNPNISKPYAVYVMPEPVQPLPQYIHFEKLSSEGEGWRHVPYPSDGLPYMSHPYVCSTREQQVESILTAIAKGAGIKIPINVQEFSPLEIALIGSAFAGALGAAMWRFWPRHQDVRV